jgi:hypothetical protein
MSFPLKFSNRVVPAKKLSYETWRDSKVNAYDMDYWDEDMTNGDYMYEFYTNLKTLIKENGYVIKNEKQFKREIATFIYQLSSEK